MVNIVLKNNDNKIKQPPSHKIKDKLNETDDFVLKKKSLFAENFTTINFSCLT